MSLGSGVTLRVPHLPSLPHGNPSAAPCSMVAPKEMQMFYTELCLRASENKILVKEGGEETGR